MSSLTDCFSCECLIDASESQCPFCGATQRNATAPSWLGVGIMLSLTFGFVTVSCAGDDGETTAEATSTATTMMSTSTVGTSTTNVNTTDDSSNADAVTYGGPDSVSDSDWGTTTTTSDPTTTTEDTSTSTTEGTSTSTTDDSGNADAVTYGGPDSLTDSDWTGSDSG